VSSQTTSAYTQTMFKKRTKNNLLQTTDVKLLGTWIGSDEYVRANLSNKLDVLRGEAEKLKGFSDLQTMYRLLSNCYYHEVNYLMRTKPNRLIEPFLTAYEELKMAHCLLMCTQMTHSAVPLPGVEVKASTMMSIIASGTFTLGSERRCSFMALGLLMKYSHISADGSGHPGLGTSSRSSMYGNDPAGC
jgi:hypothetical protein